MQHSSALQSLSEMQVIYLGLVGVIGGIIGGMGMGGGTLLIPLLCIFFAFTHTLVLGSNFHHLTLLCFVSKIMSIVSLIIYLFCAISIYFAATSLFIKTNNIWSFYKFEEIFSIITKWRSP